MQKYCIDEYAKIRDAMRSLDVIKPKILFVLKGKILVATLTDGDIRRYLMQGGTIEDCAIKAANHSPLSSCSREEAIRLYHEKDYVAIPIVNLENELIDIYYAEQMASKTRKILNIPVVINAGGKGTRLDPFTRVLPKPLIPVGDKTIIEHIMDRFLEYGCNDFHVIINYKKEILKAYFKENNKEYNITWHEENTPLGTGGGLSLLRGKLKSTFFFSNCDNLLLSEYDSILDYHKNNENVVTMICAYKNFTIPYGVVYMGANGVIDSMVEKPEISYLTNTGIYVVEPEILNVIQPEVAIGFPTVIENQRQCGDKILVYPVSEHEWLDMGQMSELRKMEQRLYPDLYK